MSFQTRIFVAVALCALIFIVLELCTAAIGVMKLTRVQVRRAKWQGWIIVDRQSNWFFQVHVARTLGLR